MSNEAEEKNSRRGSNPLPLHIGLAVAEYARLRNGKSLAPQDRALMLAGIRKYQKHSFKRCVAPLPVVWQEGDVRVYHCAADHAVASLLLVPSLINKSSILDMLPEKSFVRWLAGQGIDTYLLDWGRPVSDRGQENIDRLIIERLCPVLKHLSGKAGGALYALGYCMGGTLLAAASMLLPHDLLRGMVFLASPWDFSAGDRTLSKHVKAGTGTALQMIQQKNYLPMVWIQSVFAEVNAARTIEKFQEFSVLDDDCQKARLFVSVEDWLNDGVDLPGDLAKSFILDWYGDNKPGRGGWQVAGKNIDLAVLQNPALVVPSLNDRLVPCESSSLMADKLPDAKILQPRAGHIGMMVGSRAEEYVWRPVLEWIKEN